MRRYFPDYQIYINKLPPKIAPVDLSSHFSKFGQVINVVTTSSTVDKEPGHSVKLSHAFVKLKDSTNINRLLVQNHEINDTELRICRTFQIGESEDTDCKLHLRIDPQPTDLKSF